MTETGDAMRKDDGKSRLDLIPAEALLALGFLYGEGVKKYRQRGWEEGMAWCRCFASMMRHACKWMMGEEYDPETGAHHMIAVAWNAFALYTYHVRKVGEDDRPRKKVDKSVETA